MATASSALTVIDQVEHSPAVMQLDARSSALVELLPDAAAAARFRRVVIQALVKNPELLECTPDSVVLSVFEAAAQGLEPTGAAGGAHLVPYNVNVGDRDRPRYEKRAQLIPDYRGVIRLVTKPPSDVQSLEARVVKEGDEFEYELGTNAFVRHVPSLSAERSAKATTHVYAVARLRDSSTIPDVEDRAGIERIQKRGRGSSFSPWATDWDEMAKKTIIKRLAKVLPVRPEIRSILVREDELVGEETSQAQAPAAGGSRVSRLASRLGHAAPEPAAAEALAPAVEPQPAPVAAFVAAIREAAADPDAPKGPVTPALRDELVGALGGLDPRAIAAGFTALFGPEVLNADGKAVLTAAQARAVILAAGAEDFAAEWQSLIEEGQA